jgi:hypothetical protein
LFCENGFTSFLLKPERVDPMAKQPSQPTPGLTRKQVSRAKREARIQRWLLIGTGITVAIVAAVVAFAFINEQVLEPRRIVATINNETITVAQFQEQVQFDVYTQLGGQSPSSFGIDGATFAKYMLDAMVEQALIRQKATEMGVTVSQADIDEQVQLYFGYDAGEQEPTSTSFPTQPATQAPTETATFVYTVTPSPTMTTVPGETPTLTPTLTPTPRRKPTVTPTPSPQPTPTPLTEEDFKNNLAENAKTVSEATGISEARVKELIAVQAEATLLRDRLVEALQIEVDDIKTMIHSAHIQVTSEEEANAVIERLNSGEDFEELAAELSTDTTNAYKGGDVGWYGPGEKEEAYEQIALSTPIGQIGGPIETQFGWHLIKVYARTEVPMTPEEQERQQQEKFQEMVTTWREEGNVVIEDFWTDYLPSLLQATPMPQQ